MRFRTKAAVGIAMWAGLLLGVGFVGAEETSPPTLAIKAIPASAGRFPTSREQGGGSASVSGSPASWWLLPLGLVLAGGAWAWLSVSARKAALGRKGPGIALEVVGRVNLGPRQAVCLVRVGDQVLIVGTGPQGPPSLMGELAEPDRRPEETPR